MRFILKKIFYLFYKKIDTSQNLENISRLKLYSYNYKPDFAQLSGVQSDVGVLAQELKEIIPEAVIETGDVVLPNGEEVKNFLHVDKNRVYMECVGAVIELEKKTDHLDIRIDKLEKAIVVGEDDSSSITTFSQMSETRKITITKQVESVKEPMKAKSIDSKKKCDASKPYHQCRDKSAKDASCNNSFMHFPVKKKFLGNRLCSSRLARFTLIASILVIALG